MKHTIRRLKLTRESIRILQSEALASAQGGEDTDRKPNPTFVYSCGESACCGPTWGLTVCTA